MPVTKCRARLRIGPCFDFIYKSVKTRIVKQKKKKLKYIQLSYEFKRVGFRVQRTPKCRSKIIIICLKKNNNKNL